MQDPPMPSAAVRLRGRTGPVPGRVVWPSHPRSRRRLLLAVGVGPARAHELCATTGRAVLAVATTDGEDLDEVVRWAGAHAAELGALPDRVLVYSDTAIAAVRALQARTRADGWPYLTVFDEPTGRNRHDLA